MFHNYIVIHICIYRIDYSTSSSIQIFKRSKCAAIRMISAYSSCCDISVDFCPHWHRLYSTEPNRSVAADGLGFLSVNIKTVHFLVWI